MANIRKILSSTKIGPEEKNSNKNIFLFLGPREKLI
jgi:hypothetical protein